VRASLGLSSHSSSQRAVPKAFGGCWLWDSRRLRLNKRKECQRNQRQERREFGWTDNSTIVSQFESGPEMLSTTAIRTVDGNRSRRPKIRFPMQVMNSEASGSKWRELGERAFEIFYSAFRRAQEGLDSDCCRSDTELARTRGGLSLTRLRTFS
jgi:hypothetical protein